MVLGAQLTVDESLHPIVLLLGFERHKVHAALPGNQSIDIFNENKSYVSTFNSTKNDKDNKTKYPIQSFLVSM